MKIKTLYNQSAYPFGPLSRKKEGKLGKVILPFMGAHGHKGTEEFLQSV